MVDYAVIIPTLNAERYINRQLEVLIGQSMPPREIFVVDSQSDDSTEMLARQFSCVRFQAIERKSFDHGGTRDMAIRACDEPFIVTMTQDALPVDDRCMERLFAPMISNDRIAAVCARQVAYPEASAYERLVREFRYPDKGDVWSAEDVLRKGISAYLLSDACTAYRRSAYVAVGGFTHPIVTNEDMLIAVDFLERGYSLAYQNEARVWHSHNYNLKEEFQRNRKIGIFLKQYGDRFQSGETGEGLRLVKHVTSGLIRQGKVADVLPFWLNCAARLLGSKTGKMSRLGN